MLQKGARVVIALSVLAILFVIIQGDVPMTFSMKSNAFTNESGIPEEFTCDGVDNSPELSWTSPPAGTKSFALIMDDPDAPSGTWVHWVLYDLPENVRQLPKGVQKTEKLPNGAKQGMTDFRKVGYYGPCPPKGPAHRYYFKLYALDCLLNLAPKASKADVEKAMQGHVLAEAVLMGKYGR